VPIYELDFFFGEGRGASPRIETAHCLFASSSKVLDFSSCAESTIISSALDTSASPAMLALNPMAWTAKAKSFELWINAFLHAFSVAGNFSAYCLAGAIMAAAEMLICLQAALIFCLFAASPTINCTHLTIFTASVESALGLRSGFELCCFFGDIAIFLGGFSLGGALGGAGGMFGGAGGMFGGTIVILGGARGMFGAGGKFGGGSMVPSAFSLETEEVLEFDPV